MARLVDIPFSGADGSTTFVDNTGRVWTAQGNAKIQDNALLLSASGDTARTPGADLSPIYSGGVSVVQADIRTTNTYTGYQIILDYYMSGSGLRWQLCLYNGGKLAVYNSSNGIYIQGTTNLNDGNWHTVRMERQGTTTRLYADGVLEASYTNTIVSDSNAPYLTIGSEGSSATQWIGSIRNVILEVPDPAQPLVHKPWTVKNYVGWDKIQKAPKVEPFVWPVYKSPEAQTKVKSFIKTTRGVPPWWGPPGSTNVLPTYRLRGRVMQRDPDTGTDSPVMNAQVALFYRRLHTLIDIRISDEDGYVEFKNLMPGQNAYYAIAFDPDGGTVQNAVIWDLLSSEP